jgi:BatD DUF11 like domain
MMLRRAVLGLVACLLLSMSVGVLGAGATASLDRSTAQLGETVTLNIVIDGSVEMVMPDFGSLGQDFDILGTSSNSSLSIVNGQRSQRTTLGVALRPRRAGTLTIPALHVAGQTTQPVTLTVVAADASATARANSPVFLESAVDPASAYVGQQVGYTLRLYYDASLNLTGGSLADPQADGVEVRRLGGDTNYQGERGGRRYNIVERHYALFPQRPGAIAIAPIQFQGEAADPNDPNAFFGSTTPVSAASPSQRIEVKAHPDSAGDGAWLPAKSLTLELEGLPPGGSVRMGEPLTLTMRVQADGLPFEVLPALTLPKLEGVDVYPDKAVTGTRDDGASLVGRREQSFAVVPNRAGNLLIPEITLRWWNVQSNQAETARIPEHTIKVLPATGAIVATSPPVVSPGEVAPTASSIAPASTQEHGRWYVVALASGLLWALTIVGFGIWLLRRRRQARPAASAPAGHRSLRQAFIEAARSQDVARQEHALLAWARFERAGIRSLGDLAGALASDLQKNAIATLQRARFTMAGGEKISGDALAAAFDKGFVWHAEDSGDDASVLPPLYPSARR